MSGRKASEVSSLLSKGAEVRKAREINLKNIMALNKEYIKNNMTQMEEDVKVIQSQKCTISKEARTEFPNESTSLENRFEELKKKSKVGTYNVKGLEKEVSIANNKLESLDSECEALKQIIRNKSHYCDNEYARASQLVNEYKVVNDTKSNIAERMNKLTTRSNMDLATLESYREQMNTLGKQIEYLNQRAKDIVILRNKANEAKTFIAKSIEDINQEIAEKFMATPYQEICKLKKACETMSDSEVVKSLNSMSEMISNFKQSLYEAYEQFKLEKAQAEEQLKGLKDTIKHNKFYDPMKFIKDGENAPAMTVETFLEAFAGGIYTKEIIVGLESVERAIKEENFEQANQLSQQAGVLLEKALGYATLKQENMLKNVHLAFDIRNVMRNMNYKTNATVIDNDFSKGFRITCSVGDEIIDFDKVIVDDEGAVTIDIDHTESVTGTCATKWGSIQSELQNKGIFIQDITKNGHSILYPKRSSGKATSQLKEIR